MCGWGIGCTLSGCFSPPFFDDPIDPIPPQPTLPPPPPPTVAPPPPQTPLPPQQPQPSDPVPRFRQPGRVYLKYYFNLSFLFLDPNEDFDTFVQNCNKSYISQGKYKSKTNLLYNSNIDVDEENRRRDIFTSNLEIIKRGQFGFDNGQTSYDLKVNCAGDLTVEEFAARYFGQGQLAGAGPGVFIDPNIDPEQFRKSITRTRRRDYHSFPAELDWEQRGKI